jgi:hypothetical protein
MEIAVCPIPGADLKAGTEDGGEIAAGVAAEDQVV